MTLAAQALLVQTGLPPDSTLSDVDVVPRSTTHGCDPTSTKDRVSTGWAPAA